MPDIARTCTSSHATEQEKERKKLTIYPGIDCIGTILNFGTFKGPRQLANDSVAFSNKLYSIQLSPSLMPERRKLSSR